MVCDGLRFLIGFGTSRKAGWLTGLLFTRHTPSDTPSPESAGPSWIKNDADVTDFGPFPLDDEIVVLACEDCGKPVLSEAMSFHKGKRFGLLERLIHEYVGIPAGHAMVSWFYAGIRTYWVHRPRSLGLKLCSDQLSNEGQL